MAHAKQDAEKRDYRRALGMASETSEELQLSPDA